MSLAQIKFVCMSAEMTQSNTIPWQQPVDCQQPQQTSTVNAEGNVEIQGEKNLLLVWSVPLGY